MEAAKTASDWASRAYQGVRKIWTAPAAVETPKKRSELSEEEEIDELTKQLGRYETHIVQIQKILIFEKPAVSGVSLLAVQILIWYVTASIYRIISTIVYLYVCVYLYKVWVERVWPEIRIENNTDNNMDVEDEEWTPVETDVLSVPELSRVIVPVLRRGKAVHGQLIELYYKNPTQLYSIGGGAVILVYVLSSYLPVQYLSTVFLLTPAAWHRLGPHYKQQIQPLLSRLSHIGHREDEMIAEFLPTRHEGVLDRAANNSTAKENDDQLIGDLGVSEMPSDDCDSTDEFTAGLEKGLGYGVSGRRSIRSRKAAAYSDDED